jgi:RsiW-degrading membrane proteinase PrsW (M82 family)
VLGGAVAFFGAFYLFRLPLGNAFQSLMQGYPAWYRFGSTFYAPLTEEPAKWLILIPFFLVGKIKHENKGAWAICLGFGFGMGEIVFLAQHIASDPQTLAMPWYLSSGFIYGTADGLLYSQRFGFDCSRHAVLPKALGNALTACYSLARKLSHLFVVPVSS